MTKDKQESGRTMSCALCGSDRHRLLACEGGYVCESCLDDHRAGRDNSTRQAKLQARARRAKASLVRLAGQGLPADPELEYQVAATRSMLDTTDSHATSSTMVAGGEVVHQSVPALRNTLASPTATALDASAQRIELLGQLGVDTVALGLDAAETIGAQNSLEKMLAHQMGALHSAMFDCLSKSTMAQNSNDAIRYLNMATKVASTFQGGMLTLKRMRASGQQSITVQHVTVADGGQAVIGAVRAGGGQAE